MHCLSPAVYDLLHVARKWHSACHPPTAGLTAFWCHMITLGPASEAHSLDLPPHYAGPPLSCSRATLWPVVSDALTGGVCGVRPSRSQLQWWCPSRPRLRMRGMSKWRSAEGSSRRRSASHIGLTYRARSAITVARSNVEWRTWKYPNTAIFAPCSRWVASTMVICATSPPTYSQWPGTHAPLWASVQCRW